MTVLGADAVGAEERANDAAEEFGRRGLEARRRGDDQGALPLLQQAYRLSKAPRASAQLGFCHQALGQWVEAEARLLEALRTESDPWVHKNLAVLQKAIGFVKAHIARIEVVGEPPGAEVLINGNLAGRLPLDAPVRVPEGEVSAELRVQGRIVATRSFRVEGAHYQKVVLRPDAPDGKPAPEATAVAVSPDAAAGRPAPDDGLAASAPEASETSTATGPSSLRLAAKWIAWGVGVAGIGVGVYGVLRNDSLVSDFDSGCGIDAAGGAHSTRTARTDRQCSDLRGDYQTAGKIGIAGFVAAGVLTGVGLALWLTEPSEASGTAAARNGCLPAFGPRLEPSVGCTFRF